MSKISVTRRSKDCGVAALASYMGVAYEDVYAVALRVSPRFAKKKDGLGIDELRAVASRFKCALSPVHWSKVDLDDQRGVLGVNWNKPKEHGAPGHWVVLSEGTIIDPEGPTYDNASDYLAKNNGRAGTLLTEIE